MRPLAWLRTASLLISGAARDPAPIIARLREEDPVCWLPGLDAWLVLRHDDVRQLFADARLTTDQRYYERYEEPSVEGAARWLVALPLRAQPSDPRSAPRSLAAAMLTPRAVERAEARIREVVARFAGPLHGRSGVVDLMAEFTVPTATLVIARLLGVPPTDAAEADFRRLARNATRRIRPFLTETKRRRSESAVVEICDYVLGLVETRRAQPADDMISDLLRASPAADQAHLDNIVRIVSALVSAGTGTTSIACARSLRTLLRHPRQLAQLRENRSLLAGAVGELLRYDSGLVVMPRYALEDIELRGCVIRKGQLVALSPLGANRDPRVFERPDELDLGRDTTDALSFGHGPHHCFGSNVARAELRAMLDAALDFLPAGARVVEEGIRWSSRGAMGQIKSLPVDFAA